MEINWKDFGLMYVIGYFWNQVLIIIQRLLFPMSTNELHISYYPFTALLFALPLAFYFWRNKSTFFEAAAFSLIFSFTYAWVFLLLINIPINIIQSQPLGIINIYSAMPGYMPLMIRDTLIGMISGLIAWLAIKNSIKESRSK